MYLTTVNFIFQFIWLFSIITLGPVTYGTKAYPDWAVTLGWCLGSISLIPIPTVAIFQIMREDGPILDVSAFGSCNNFLLRVLFVANRFTFLQSLKQKKIW